MAPEHSAVLPLCEEKFKLYDKHLEDAPTNRDKIVEHDTKIKVLCTDLNGLKNWIVGSTTSIIVTILLAALAVAVTWGKTLEKVERLDRISQSRMEK